MILTERTINIIDHESIMDSPVVLYRGDKNVELKLNIKASRFKFRDDDSSNFIESAQASYGQLIIQTPNQNEPIFSEITATKKGCIIFLITAEMIDEIDEVGKYTFQVRLLDSNKRSRATIPPVVNGIEIREPITSEDSNVLNSAVVGLASAANEEVLNTFDADGNYAKTNWKFGDKITAAKLNKSEDGIYQSYALSLANASQLNQKLNKGDKISVDQIRKDGTKLDQTWMSEEFLQQMAGNAPINSVPADKSITVNKFDDSLSNIIQHGSYHVVGRFETFEKGANATINVTWTRIYFIKPTTSMERLEIYYVKVQAEPLTINNNEYLYIDLEGHITGQEVEMKVGNPETYDFVNGKKYIVFYNSNGRYSGPLASSMNLPNNFIEEKHLKSSKIIGGHLIKDGCIKNEHLSSKCVTINKTEDIVQNMLNRSSWEALVAPNYDWEFDSEKNLTINNLGRIYIYEGAVGGFFQVENKTSLTVGYNNIAYVDLDDTEKLSGGVLPIRIGDTPGSAIINGQGAFKWDRKIPLLVNINGLIGGKLAKCLKTKNKNKNEDSFRQTGVWFKMYNKPIYFDESTKTLTWEGILLYIDRNLPPTGSDVRVKLNPGSYTFGIDTYNVCYLDLNSVTETELNDPSTCIKGGAYYEGGYNASKGQIPIAKFDKFDKGFEVINFPTVTSKSAPTHEISLIRDELIYVNVKGNGVIEIIRQSSEESGKYYICINFVHSISPSINSNVWRLSDAWIYTKNEDNTFSKYSANSIVTGGEWECALKEQGAADFIGGLAHGDENVKDIVFLLDGLPIDVNTPRLYAGKKVIILENSILNRCDTPSDIVADHVRHYEFTKDDLIITQKVTWKKSLTMHKSYLTMFPIKRTINNDDNSDYVTNRGFKNVYFETLDLSANHHNTAYQTGGITEATLWNEGPGYKVFGKVEVLESNKLPNENMAFSAALAYNKCYFDYCGIGYVTQVGEVWNNKARYILDFKGYQS